MSALLSFVVQSVSDAHGLQSLHETGCLCGKPYSDIVMMKSAKDRMASQLHSSRNCHAGVLLLDG
jgi:hypothetical protein